MDQRTSRPNRSGVYLNAVLTVIALLLGALLVQKNVEAPVISSADAGEPARGIVNPADQRREIINQLRRVNDRLDKIAGDIKAPMEVEVVRMPSGANGD